MLENKMINIDKRDEDGCNAFLIAAMHGHGDVMRVLAENGIQIYSSDYKHGNNALHLCASSQERYPILEMLVRSKYNLNLKNNNGDTAAHIAAQKGNFRHLCCLVEAGAQINFLNSHFLSPLYLSILNKMDQCSRFLLEHGAKPFFSGDDTQKDHSPIFLAVRKENQDILRRMFNLLDSAEQVEIRTS